MATMMAPSNHSTHNTAALGKDINHMRTHSYNQVQARPASGYQPQPQRFQPQQQQPILHVSPPSSSNNYRQNPLHAAQIRPLKSPLYVPAVLRPTEKPQRHSPPKGNEEEGRPGDESWGAIVGSEEMAASPGVINSPILGRTGVTSITMDELLERKGPVTGIPSTNHWKPDTAALTCNARLCSARFGLLTRRHHCRRCGNIFCWQHSARRAPLDQHALFHPAGTQSRVCDRCYRCYADWEMKRSSRTSSESSGSTGSSGSSSLPVHIRAGSVSSAPGDVVNERGDEEQTGESHENQSEFRPKSFVTSIPNHWNWSTF